ncbi:MAG: DUF2334 domain-containing protein [bacterium]
MLWRIDDVGASTKRFNQYGKKRFYLHKILYFYFPLANLWFFKRIKPFRTWGPYPEVSSDTWEKVIELFKRNSIVPIISVTAAWVDEKSNLIPFNKKFSAQAKVLKDAFKRGEIIIANHGLTHCVVGKHLPRLLYSNREFHREFWPYLDQTVHEQHITQSQKILEEYFEKPITIFVPPGNVWSIKTYNSLKKTNIKKIICNRYMIDSDVKLNDIEFIDDRRGCFLLHDRDLHFHDQKWLADKINQLNQ